jgi:hypothetical protein
MMDINKYILSQIKIDEKLLKLVEQQEKQPTKVIKHESKQKPNSFLLDLINENIKNEKRLTAHYKSIATGLPVVQEDDNIRLISSNQELNTNLENQFYFLMSKYVKDQSQLTDIKENLTPEMISEIVHNWAMYEPEIKRYKGQYINNLVFADKLRNLLLKNVNLKYPSTISLNSKIDASKEPAIEMQKAFEAKNQAVNEKHSQSEVLFEKLEFIIQALGKSADECSKQYELWYKVFEIFYDSFKEIGDKYDIDHVQSSDFMSVIDDVKQLLEFYIKKEPVDCSKFLDELISIYTGTCYLNLEPLHDIRSLILPNIVKKSFRTKVISMLDKKYNAAYTKSTHKNGF